MSKPRIPMLSFFLALVSAAAFCQTEISDPGAKQICASVKDVEIPAADRPARAEESALAGCSSVDAYFGFGGPVDPVKARKCALAEIDRDARTPLGGKTILMMVYANGKGVHRNFDLALKLACTIGGAPGDAAGRVHQLDRLKKENWTGDNFSICAHSSGHELYEQCAILQERFDQIERDQKFDELTVDWSARDRKAFHSFLAQAEEFFHVQAMNGVNLEGTFEVSEEAFLKNGLLAALEQFERGELPGHSAAELQHAEAAESAAYLRTQTGSVAAWGTVTRESVKKSEEAWRRYRDAWISFARQKYPSVSVQSWKTWLAVERTTMLNRFLN